MPFGLTLLAPGWLAAGVAASLALVALHLLAIGRPAPFALPTARFVPLRAARARRLARRPTDRLLLAMRVAAVLLAALALARPTRTPTRRAVARVIVADRSGASADIATVRAEVRAVAEAGDVLIPFDTVAAAPITLASAGATPTARDSAVAIALGTAPAGVPAGSLSAALAAARRAAPTVRDAADSIELVIVSPLTTAELDAATDAVRRAWRGRARVVRTGAAPAIAVSDVRVVARGPGTPRDDALATAVAVATNGARSGGAVARSQGTGGAAGDVRVEVGGPPPTISDPANAANAANAANGARRAASVRIVRDGVTPADAAWARDSAGILLDWPVDGAPATWTPRPRVDTAGAVAAGLTAGREAVAFVAPMARRVAWTGTDARVIARWADGAPAAIERAAGAGCVREVAVPVPQVGDAALRPPFRALLAALTGPCAHRDVGAPLDSATVRTLAGTGPLLAARSLGTTSAPRDPLARWLLAAALALLVSELPLRRVGARRDETRTPSDDATVEAAA